MKKHIPLILSLVFAVGVYLSWALAGKSLLSFHEQYQLFLFTSDYFLQRVAVPGGMGDWLAEFLTQFYYLPWAGAMVIAVLLLLLQRLTWVVSRRSGATPWAYPLSFLPVVLLWGDMGNPNVLLSLVVGLLAALELMLHHIIVDDHTTSRMARLTYLLVGLPVFYWLFGAVVWVVAAFVVVYELMRGRDLWCAVTAVLWTLAMVLVVAQFVPYPVSRLLSGLNYYRYPEGVPVMQAVVMAAFAWTPLLAAWLKGGRVLAAVTSAVVVLSGVAALHLGFDKREQEVIEYDYLVRTHQWDAIIEKAEHKQADMPLTVSCVNMALAMKGQLCDRLFEFYQNGAEGLIPSFQRDMTTPLPTSELFFILGMTNDAERFAFEAQEAIPNYRKSGRMTKRLAECNIVNGHYRVARKYLRVLTHSLFYRHWANEQLELLRQPARVAADSQYGELRTRHIRHTDFLFSDREMDQMLGFLFVDGKKYTNRMAYEYLIAYELLERNLDRFMQYYALGQHVNFDHIPYAIQQVLVGEWLQRHGSLQGMPYSVDEQNVRGTMEYIQAYIRNRQDPALSQPPLCHNAWHYLSNAGGRKRAKEKSREIY